jgi:hypothetical protein
MQRLAALRRARGFATAATPLRATLFPGDGVGPEIAEAVTQVLRTAGVAIEWEKQVVNHDKPDPRTNSFITRENLDSVKARSRDWSRRARRGRAAGGARSEGLRAAAGALPRGTAR